MLAESGAADSPGAVAVAVAVDKKFKEFAVLPAVECDRALRNPMLYHRMVISPTPSPAINISRSLQIILTPYPLLRLVLVGFDELNKQ
jgi:hypothetical protein